MPTRRIGHSLKGLAMPTFKFSIRTLIAVVSLIAIALAVDRRVEFTSNQFLANIESDPSRLGEQLLPGDGAVNIEMTRNATSIADRMLFRRRFYIVYSKTITDGDNFREVQVSSAYIATLFSQTEVKQRGIRRILGISSPINDVG